jgi:hypothetical protein
MKKLINWLFGKRKCNHAFEIKYVIDLTKDPNCVKCGRLLSEVKKEI